MLRRLWSGTKTRGLTYEQAYLAGLVAERTSAGIPVTEETALGQSPVWAALRLISTGIASIPLVTYRRDSKGDRIRAPEHPLYRILHDRPNPEMTAFSFWQAQTCQQLLYGAMVAEIERNGAGEPVALWPLPADRVEPFRTDAGELAYRFHGNRSAIVLDPWNVWYVPYLTLDGITGKGILRYARETIGLARAMERTAGRQFTNMVKPSGAIEAPPGMSETAISNIKRSVERENSGSDNVARLLMLWEGVKFTPYQISHADAQLIESRGFSIVEVARFFNVSPTKLGDLGRATWSNLESENRALIENTYLPILIGREQESNSKLLAEGEPYYTESLVEARLRANTLERYQSYALGLDKGFLTIAEVRRAENLPELEPEPEETPEPEPTEEQNGTPATDPGPDAVE